MFWYYPDQDKFLQNVNNLLKSGLVSNDIFLGLTLSNTGQHSCF